MYVSFVISFSSSFQLSKCKPYLSTTFLPFFIRSFLLLPNICSLVFSVRMESMDRCHQKRSKITITDQSEEVISNEWKFVSMTEQEEDLIYRMYRLVGPRWDLIAGRIPGRKAEVLERFWIMRHCDAFAEKRNQHKIEGSNI